MRFKVPQDVQREDTIIGPITFKQLIIMIIGGGIGYYFLTKPRADTLSFVFGTIPAFTLGFGLSFLPKYSEKLTLSDGGWAIYIE